MIERIKLYLKRIRQSTVRYEHGSKQMSSDWLMGYEQGKHDLAVQLQWAIRKGESVSSGNRNLP